MTEMWSEKKNPALGSGIQYFLIICLEQQAVIEAK